MKFDVKEEADRVIVEVELSPSRRGKKPVPRQRVETKDVLEELSTRGIVHGKAIQTASVKNWREHTRRGTWIFEKKIEKVLDKPAENVILSKEEKPAPKKRKSRAKKKTSK
jgi:hypothetical protein